MSYTYINKNTASMPVPVKLVHLVALDTNLMISNISIQPGFYNAYNVKIISHTKVVMFQRYRIFVLFLQFVYLRVTMRACALHGMQ